ncbi:MAG: hypothetical protein EP330_07150 [Deltaproteobacteria bacterium]|nr:MAG: hypothetical protein EP330_07150 [Deltaproteobacteria bacterium]
MPKPSKPLSEWARTLPEARLQLTFACPVAWDAMQPVGEGVRHCGTCARAVFELRGRAAAEVQALVTAHGGELCGQAWVREDGRLVFGECEAPRRLLRGRIRPRD